MNFPIKWIIFPGIPTLLVAVLLLTTHKGEEREAQEKSLIERMAE